MQGAMGNKNSIDQVCLCLWLFFAFLGHYKEPQGDICVLIRPILNHCVCASSLTAPDERSCFVYTVSTSFYHWLSLLAAFHEKW